MPVNLSNDTQMEQMGSMEWTVKL